MTAPKDSPLAGRLPGSFKVRLSFSRRDISLASLYQEMASMAREAERRAFLRQILYRALSQSPTGQPQVASPALQAPILPATLAMPAAPQLKEIVPGTGEPARSGALPKLSKSEIFKKFGVLD